MNFAKEFRALRMASLAVMAFAALLSMATLAQLGLGAMAVNAEYERIEQREALMASPRSYYGYQRQWRETQAEYDRSSSAFFLEGRFLNTSLDEGANTAAVVAMGALLLGAIGFLVSSLFWVWRAHGALRKVGIRSKFGPREALTAYLVPVANLFLPFEAMRELHNRSHGEPEDFAHSSVENVTAWWTSVAVGLFILSALLVKFALDAATNLVLMTPLWMEFGILCFSALLILTGAWLFAGLTRAITAAQEAYLPSVDSEIIETNAPERPSVTFVSGQA